MKMLSGRLSLVRRPAVAVAGGMPYRDLEERLLVQRRVWLSGAIILIVNALQWVIAEAVTAAAWDSPPHSYATNYINDLGVTECGARFQGRELCSPMHTLMNVSFVAEGILFATGVVLLAQLLDGIARRVVIILGIAHGAGMAVVGFFPSTPDPSSGAVFQAGAAGVAILCSNLVVILAGALKNLRLPAAYRIFSIAVGVLGIISVLLVGVSERTVGTFERGSVYAWLLWSVVTGMLLLVRGAPQPAVLGHVRVS
ncbi:DUF998 domain-containing protein [Streptomyces sp. IBSNAI002]|uniref:DUF998 domain-containing protein n=1 Tax=Streptomyces sp. IBSNAI002 TaxID=3457500 RepID=UPI003FD1D0FB